MRRELQLHKAIAPVSVKSQTDHPSPAGIRRSVLGNARNGGRGLFNDGDVTLPAVNSLQEERRIEALTVRKLHATTSLKFISAGCPWEKNHRFLDFETKKRCVKIRNLGVSKLQKLQTSFYFEEGLLLLLLLMMMMMMMIMIMMMISLVSRVKYLHTTYDDGSGGGDDIPCFQGKYLEILRRLFVSGCPVSRCFPVSVCRPNPRGKGRNRK